MTDANAAGWSTDRPTGAVYQQAYDNIGKYGTNAKGKPYIEPAIPVYVPAEGENCIRIVDPIELLQLQAYYLDVFFHRDVGFLKDYFLCTKEMAVIAGQIGYPQGAGPCYRCNKVTSELWDADKEEAKRLLPDHRRLMWVLNLKKPEEAGELNLWSCPRTLSDEILSQSREPGTNVFKDIAHPVTGVPVYFTRTGKLRNTKYTGVKLGTQPYPIGYEIAQQRFYFKDILIWPKPGELEASEEYRNVEQMEEEALGPAPPASSYDNDPALPPNPETSTLPPASNIPVAETEFDYSMMEQLTEDVKDCFRKDFDKYQECDPCSWREECQKPWPLKQAKPTKTPRPSAPGGKTPKGGDDTGSTTTGAPGGAGGSAGTPQTPPQRVRSGASAPLPQPGSADPGNAARIAAAKEKLRQEIEARRNAQQ